MSAKKNSILKEQDSTIIRKDAQKIINKDGLQLPHKKKKRKGKKGAKDRFSTPKVKNIGILSDTDALRKMIINNDMIFSLPRSHAEDDIGGGKGGGDVSGMKEKEENIPPKKEDVSPVEDAENLFGGGSSNEDE